MTTTINYKNKIIKIDTIDKNDRELLGNHQQDKLEDILISKGFLGIKLEQNIYSNYDYYQELKDKSVIIELKTTTKKFDTFDTELINLSKIQGIYNKVLENRKKNIKTIVLIIYSYPNSNEMIILKVKWSNFEKFTKKLIFNKEHYLIPKKEFEQFDKIDEYLKDFKSVIEVK